MRLPTNFIARLKDIARRRSRGFGNDTGRIVWQWFFILLFTFGMVAVAAGFAIYRFNYWSSIEEKVEDEEVGATEYDESAIEKILMEFKEKEEAAEALKALPLPHTTSPAETTIRAVDGSEARPALGE